jgi:hypothetical protein
LQLRPAAASARRVKSGPGRREKGKKSAGSTEEGKRGRGQGEGQERAGSREKGKKRAGELVKQKHSRGQTGFISQVVYNEDVHNHINSYGCLFLIPVVAGPLPRANQPRSPRTYILSLLLDRGLVVGNGVLVLVLLTSCIE